MSDCSFRMKARLLPHGMGAGYPKQSLTQRGDRGSSGAGGVAESETPVAPYLPPSLPRQANDSVVKKGATSAKNLQ